MSKSKKKIVILFSIIAVVQVLIAFFKFGDKVNIGILPETGKFGIQTVEADYDLGDKITEEFQPDTHFKNENIHRKKHGEKELVPKIWGSESIYKLFSYISGTPVKAAQLVVALLLTDLFMIFLALFIRKRILEKPSKSQIVFEMIYSFFENLVEETLGEKRRNFTPYVLTLFLFIWISNLIGLIPLPGFIEPTQNLNVPLGLGIMAVFVVHFMAIKVKGLKDYLKGYAEPFVFLAPLNFIGEISKAVSISFRLFGNVLGGAIIILVVSSLVRFVLLPVGLNLFFGIFIGTIQAFVFTMLALTYIAVEIED